MWLCKTHRSHFLPGESYTMAKVKTLTAHTVLAGLSVRSPRHKLVSRPWLPERKLCELEIRVLRSWQSGQRKRMWKALPSVTYKRTLEFQKYENSNTLALVGMCDPALPTVPRVGDISKSHPVSFTPQLCEVGERLCSLWIRAVDCCFKSICPTPSPQC